jgi:hypothetical protein
MVPMFQERDMGHPAGLLHPTSQNRDVGHPVICGESDLGHPAPALGLDAFGLGRAWRCCERPAAEAEISSGCIQGPEGPCSLRQGEEEAWRQPTIGVRVIPGQKIQTWGTLNVVWKSHRERGHPPETASGRSAWLHPRPPTIVAQRPLIAKNAMNGAQILKNQNHSSGAMTGPPADDRATCLGARMALLRKARG